MFEHSKQAISNILLLQPFVQPHRFYGDSPVARDAGAPARQPKPGPPSHVRPWHMDDGPAPPVILTSERPWPLSGIAEFSALLAPEKVRRGLKSQFSAPKRSTAKGRVIIALTAQKSEYPGTQGLRLWLEGCVIGLVAGFAQGLRP